MTELSEKPPSGIKQVLNYNRGRHILKDMDYKPKTMQRGIIHGLLTIAPDIVENYKILEDKERLVATDALIKYQIGINDRIDFEGSNRPDLDDLTQITKQEEQDRHSAFQEAIQKLPENDRKLIEQQAETALQEVEIVEEWIRKKRDTYPVSFQDMNHYRNTVNAISEVQVMSMMLGPDVLAARLPTATGKMEIQDIMDKYAWLSGRSSQNSIEQAMMIMHNIAMSSQVVDDWNDRKIDGLLNTPSFASAAFKMLDGDEEQAGIYLKTVQQNYQGRAQFLGLGKVPSSGITQLFNVFAKAKSVRAEIAHQTRGRNYKYFSPKSRLFGFREEMYTQGKLDRKAEI